MTLLKDVSDAELRAKGIEALRRWRKKPPLKPSHPYGPGFNAPPPPPPDPLDVSPNDDFSMHSDLGIELVKLLAEAKGFSNPNTQRLQEVFVDSDAMQKEWSRPILEFVWWLGRAGLAVEIQHHESTPIRLRLTRRGACLLDSTDDNPMLPGFLDRIRSRCPKLPDGVIALLVDARACLDRSLLRPAVVLMGVAYELAIEEVTGELVTKGLVQPNTPKELPAKRIERIKELNSVLAMAATGAAMPARRAWLAGRLAARMRPVAAGRQAARMRPVAAGRQAARMRPVVAGLPVRLATDRRGSDDQTSADLRRRIRESIDGCRCSA